MACKIVDSDPDPGWRLITWDEALSETAAALRRIAAESGAEAVAFDVTTSSGTPIRGIPRYSAP